MVDAHKNFAYSTIATAPSPASSGTSLVVAAGEGALFPAVPFNATIWPTGVQPLATNAEIVRVTNISTDTLTITRAQEGTSARTVVVGDQIAATITNLTLTDIEGLIHDAVTIGADGEHSIAGQVLSGVLATTSQKGHAQFDATAPAAVGTAAAGASGIIADRAHVHPTGAGTPSTQAFGDAAAVGAGPAAAMTDHKHAMPANPVSANGAIRTITIVIDGGGSAITTGVKGDLEIPFACTINRATLLADQSGSIVIDIWKDTYANYPPTVADTITASAKPTISAATKSQDSTLTGWTTSIAAGDTLRFNVDSITTCTRVTLSLKATET